MFKLKDSFVAKYATLEPDWGYGELGKFTYYRTYSRKKEDGTQEHWIDTVRRVVEGTYELQRRHCLEKSRAWSDETAEDSAEEMFDRMFNMKFLPPGRGLWMMGTSYVMDRKNGAPLQNCGFISTKSLHEGSSRPFTWLMDMSMLGVGVGFDTLGAGAPVKGYRYAKYDGWFVIEDSREGWVDSVRKLIDVYLSEDGLDVRFDYSKIRPEGSPINGFGGTASGAAPLKKLHDRIRKVLGPAALRGYITSTDIVDIQNMIGACVVAGNVRRSAEIALGGLDDSEFLDLKNLEINPSRAQWSWASNNSLIIRDGDNPDYAAIAKRIADNGEPGLVYIDNARSQGRMGDFNAPNDEKVAGFNPCAEQQLEDGELCNLVEVFPTRCDNIVDYLRTIKFAYLYAKTVTLVPTHDETTNEIMNRNRRIGTSNSGVVQFLHTKGSKDVLEQWSEAGYGYIDNLDKKYSAWLDVPVSVRKTTIKPSGTISILAGVTPGVHYPVADTHIRRVRVQDISPLVQIARDAGYHIEPDQFSDNTMVIEFPVKGKGIPDERTVSIFDKADVATFMAKHWSDNAVSCTITFKEEESSMIETVIRQNQDKWKTVSFLKIDAGAYPQMPYESISLNDYFDRMQGVSKMDFSSFTGDGEMEKFCTTDACELKLDFGELETV